MSKWIAEFELEDGDTMPEHMDLKYKGVKIDFHCKPVEQESTTKIDESNFSQEQYLADIQSAYDCGKSIIDKIRAEIEKTAFVDANGSKYIFVNRVNQIIDKYKAESEET